MIFKCVDIFKGMIIRTQHMKTFGDETMSALTGEFHMLNYIKEILTNSNI